MSNAVEQIIANYAGESPGVLGNLRRLLNSGALAGTGKLVILPVDQGFEHGPARSFAPNPPAYDPLYHFHLAIEAGCSALAAPLGFLEIGARHAPGEVPLILKLNGRDSLLEGGEPSQAIQASIDDALRLGCIGVGYTIYPGSAKSLEMYQGLREIAREAKSRGLVVVVWSYPRGGGLTKEDETAIDVVAYAAHIAAELGAHIIKVKVPTARLAQLEARRVYEDRQIPVATPADRVRHVVQATFAGRRIVIFSGGPAKARDQDVLDEIIAIRDGGGFGTIIGRNTFQRPESAAKKLLAAIADVLSVDALN